MCVLRLLFCFAATATKKTEKSICEMLRIPFDGVVRCSSVRKNNKLSVSIVPTDRYIFHFFNENFFTNNSYTICSGYRYTSLIALLQSPQFSSLSSIIIYCMFQKDADNLASFLNLHGFDAASYHAGTLISPLTFAISQFCSFFVTLFFDCLLFCDRKNNEREETSTGTVYDK
jgi:superfamily II DNA helicase RecQ